MRTTRYTLTAVAAVMLLAPLSYGAAADPAATHQNTDVLAFDGFADVGDAHLVRNDNGITTRLRLSGLQPGVYTLWWVVWNAPGNCATPFACTDADVFNPDVQVAIGRGGGRIVGSHGNLNLAASLAEHQELTGFPTEFGIPTADALADARHAEAHVVLRSHGPKIPGLTNEMLHTFNAGCVYESPIDGTEPAYGTPGPNDCEDLYFAVFPSENATG